MYLFLGKGSQSRIRIFISKGKHAQFSCFTGRSPFSSTFRKVKLSAYMWGLSLERQPASFAQLSTLGMFLFFPWSLNGSPSGPELKLVCIILVPTGQHFQSTVLVFFFFFFFFNYPLRPTLSCLPLLFVLYFQIPINILVSALIKKLSQLFIFAQIFFPIHCHFQHKILQNKIIQEYVCWVWQKYPYMLYKL